MEGLYSLENAQKFNWSSISGNLNAERVSHLETYLVGNKILDAGCGGGAYVEFLSHKGHEVTGIDKYDEFLQVAREQGREGTYIQGDLTNLPFADNTFDCTFCFDVLEHIDDQIAIQELARVTKKRLIIAVPKEDEIMKKFNLTFFHYQDKTHLRNYTENSLKSLFSKISHSKITIFPELALPTKYIVQEMIDFKKPNLGLSYLYNTAINLLLKDLLNRYYYKQIYTGLIGIVDIKES
jgi:SAM-dependent methyltransferase